MYIKYAVHGLLLWATVTSAFNPYVKPDKSKPKIGSVGGSHKVWKPLKAPRDAKPFLPVEEKPVDMKKMKPMKELQLKKIPRADNGLHPQIRAVQHANAVTKKFRKRGIAGDDSDGEQAIRDVVSSLQKRSLGKRQNNFDTVKSNVPSSPGTMAVDQDGNDFSYFSQVDFGSKNKTFLLVIDTGSSDTWVYSSNCSAQACSNHETLGADDSDTLEVSSNVYRVSYGSGIVSGILARDDISFAGFGVKVEFGLTISVTSQFVNFPIDGIMGLGFPTLSTQGVDGILDVLVNNNLIDSRTFSIALSRASDGLNDGAIQFGGINEDYYTGTMEFSDSDSEHGYWEIVVDDAAHSGTSYGFGPRNAIIDTGTSLILLAPDDAYAFHLGIDDSRSDGSSFAVPCNTTQTIDITISGVTYSIPPIDWVGAPVEETAVNYCLSHVVSKEVIVGANTWLLGDVFLKNVYANFDLDKSRIGFAKRASPLSPNSETPTSGPTSVSATIISTATSTPTSDSGNNGTGKNDNGNGSGAAGGLTVSLSLILGAMLLSSVMVA